MAKVPTFLLRHRIGVQQYLGVWGVYGARTDDLPVQLQERLSPATSTPGSPRFVIVTGVGKPDMAIGEGAIAYLPDGRTGWVNAVAHHTAPGLPVPEHVEFAIEIHGAGLPPAGGAETVVVIRRIPAGRDRYNNVRYAQQETVIEAAAVRPLSSQESGPAQMGAGRSQLVDTIEVLLPPGTEVVATSRLRVRGLTYEVDGTPEVLRDPMSGTDSGVKVIGKRVS